VATLIRDNKRFNMLTPSDVLGRILTFDMQREEALERREIGELQAKLDGMKIKDIALKANKTTNNSNESDSEDESHEGIGDIALFVKKYHKGLKKEGCKVVKRRFPNKKKRTCYNCGSTEHFIDLCPHEKKRTSNTRKREEKDLTEAHIGHQWR
jgi:hypothetical protein